MPAIPPNRNTVTTQPMGMPARPLTPPVPESNKGRSTQRLVVTPNAAGKLASTRPLATGPAGLINLPAGMILRCLPADMLAAPLAEFESTGAAAMEVGLPINAILSQLPSGKVELPVRDIVAQLPPGFLKSTAEINPYLASIASLPLMDVVMRIPPDLLAVRPDQKEVDASVRRMADPFTGDTLAAAAPSAPPPVGHPPEPEPDPAPVEPPASPSAFAPSPVSATSSFVPPVMPTTAGPAKTGSIPAPARTTRSFVPPQRHASMELLQQSDPATPRPTARTTPMPGRVLPPPEGAVPMPPAPRQLSASQMISVPRPATPILPTQLAAATTSGPLEPRVASAGGVTAPSFHPQIPPINATTVMPPSARPMPPVEKEAAAPPAPTPNVDELQRLAALANAAIEEKPAEGDTEEAFAAGLPEARAAQPTPDPVLSSSSPGELGTAVTSRIPLPQVPSRDLAETASLAAAAAPEPVRPPAQAEPVRLPTTPEPIRAPEPNAAAAETLRPAVMRPSPASADTTRMNPPEPEPEAPAAKPNSSASPTAEPPAGEGGAPTATAVNLNNCAAVDLLPIPGMTRKLADNIVQHREKIGEFHKLEELLDVPGMTREAYANLTGETPPSGVHHSVNDLLGFPLDQELSLKDVTDRIACWPDVTGCLLSQKNGLHLVGSAPDFLDKEAIVAFAPRLFEDMNKSFIEITGRESDELIIPTTGTSFHLLREKDLYLVILSRLPQMPERHLKIARFVLAGLAGRSS